MDIARAPKSNRRRYVYGAVAIAAVAAGTMAVMRLKPAAPSVDRGTLMIDSVRRGPLVIQVRGPGTLVPVGNLSGTSVPSQRTWIIRDAQDRVDHQGAAIDRRCRRLEPHDRHRPSRPPPRKGQRRKRTGVDCSWVRARCP